MPIDELLRSERVRCHHRQAHHDVAETLALLKDYNVGAAVVSTDGKESQASSPRRVTSRRHRCLPGPTIAQ